MGGHVSSLNKSSTSPAGETTPRVNTEHGNCDLCEQGVRYQWELVDSNVLQTALNYRKELISWNNNEKKLRNKMYTIKKGYLNLRLDDLDDKASIQPIRDFFDKAIKECKPEFIIKAYTISQKFSQLLNNDMARIIRHDIYKGCSLFSCDSLYTAQDGTKSIASILCYYPGFVAYAGEVYRGIYGVDEFTHMQENECIMLNTFVSTSKGIETSDVFSAYDRDKKNLCQPNSQGMISIGLTFRIKNINENRRAIDISSISTKEEGEDEVLLMPYSVFLITKRETIEFANQNAKRIEMELEEYDPTKLNPQ